MATAFVAHKTVVAAGPSIRSWRGSGRRFGCLCSFVLFLVPLEIAPAPYPLFHLVVLLAHMESLFVLLRNEVICFFASPINGSPCANVAVLKSNSSSRRSDRRICLLSSTYCEGNRLSPLPVMFISESPIKTMPPFCLVWKATQPAVAPGR